MSPGRLGPAAEVGSGSDTLLVGHECGVPIGPVFVLFLDPGGEEGRLPVERRVPFRWRDGLEVA